ncbi:MAG TPA: DUF6264 family protein [Microbacterium sp.]|uniref:DUF6264 family protein n=1 Tax=Microbacterium sp. TaxID=51671 RepID=UPI002B492626|nr:DUF6264 family protein [Microbacterium sp.]HKT55218.1 DUF6264 family protein [Microbacterium sp.]
MTEQNGEQQRPRPQFGEYATPEQQRAHIRQPMPEPPVPHPDQLLSASPASPGASPMQPRAVDRLATIMLLGFGVVYVVLQLPQYFDFAALAGEMMKTLGIAGTFTNVTAGRIWGVVAAFLLVLGYLLTLLLALRRLRLGKVTWWLPLVGAVLTYIVVGICVAVPVMGDPAVASYLQQSAG